MMKFKLRVACAVLALTFAVVPFISCDGNPTGFTSREVNIGNLTWMAENLNRNIDGSWCYNNDNSNCAKYGRLYTWHAAMSACPAGWRLPTRSDWNNLVSAAGGGSVAGVRLKSKTGWTTYNGTDDYGFSALPGGFRSSFDGGTFVVAGNVGYWWSTAESSSNNAVSRSLGDNNHVYESSINKSFGLSVRCVKN